MHSIIYDLLNNLFSPTYMEMKEKLQIAFQKTVFYGVDGSKR